MSYINEPLRKVIERGDDSVLFIKQDGRGRPLEAGDVRLLRGKQEWTGISASATPLGTTVKFPVRLQTGDMLAY